MIPPWAVAIVILFIIILLLSSYYIFKKKLNKRTAVGTIKHEEDMIDVRKEVAEERPIQCHFADKMELDSNDPYYHPAFVSIDLNSKQEPTVAQQTQAMVENHSNMIIPEEQGEPEAVARQAIRSASRKSRTRSMIITDASSVFTNKVPDISTYATLRRPPPPLKPETTPHPTLTRNVPPKNPSRDLQNLFNHHDNDNESISSQRTAIREEDTIKNHTAPRHTNVDTIRRMLQSSWSGHQLKSSESSSTISNGSIRPVASPVGSINPRLQNQHLVSLSLRPKYQRPSIIGYMEPPQ
ncbi:hypothetical protein G6F57_006964 [Rhizopus arrhizus]|uniref:Uncharacterized protein n=1 Tax=Rhizopus oryzae TaxID=64495 RepID=A0A9P7BX73_RHIOR|nr:hypothetical protein G6F23_006733 [Rhizopus arrhizus]KAG1402889.1 hypothetical protein G6F58_010483 [Rhizopus delemar]KAG0767081.1 hypothetical protein G6F24_003090 [Rhizopus arrhizus]KAG0784009.1 hypothetical protein G6F22_008466 [Rhizopus arrhizus]KAG0793936.1 hypothetical protein G6F21_003242 [Rhizopus arrhizus]